MRVTVESHFADVVGCLRWLADNDLPGPVYEVELVNEGEALVYGYVRDPTQQPDNTVVVYATGSEPFLLTYRRRMPVRTLPPAAALVP